MAAGEDVTEFRAGRWNAANACSEKFVPFPLLSV